MIQPAYTLSLLKVPVSDIGKSAAFYRDVLGFAEQFVAAEYGWAQFTAGDIPLALYKPGMGGGTGTPGGSVGFHLDLSAEAFDALAADLLQRGVLFDDRIQRGDDGSVFIEVRDPDANKIAIGRAT